MAPQKQARPCHQDRKDQRNSAPHRTDSKKNYRAVKGKESVKRKFQTKIGQPEDEEEAECDHSTADDVTRRLQPPHSITPANENGTAHGKKRCRSFRTDTSASLQRPERTPERSKMAVGTRVLRSKARRMGKPVRGPSCMPTTTATEAKTNTSG